MPNVLIFFVCHKIYRGDDFMKKTVSFTKDLEFPMQIGEITQITLEDDLKFIDKNNIEGKFIIAGKYKMTEASRIEEDFSFNLPVEISITENCELDTCKISIIDFKYEIIDEDILRTNIDVLVEGVEIIEDLETTEQIDRECDGEEKKEEEKEMPTKDENNNIFVDVKEEKVDYINMPTEDIIEEKIKIDDNTNSLFSNLGDDEDNFSTYSIYIMREGDTLEKVMEKYSVTKENLEEYNDISTITLNSKIVIPSVKDE